VSSLFSVSLAFTTRTKQARIAADLIELRNKSVFAFLMFNALFVLIVFLLQLNKDQLHVVWPLGVKTNITYVEETSEVSDDQASGGKSVPYVVSYTRCLVEITLDASGCSYLEVFLSLLWTYKPCKRGLAKLPNNIRDSLDKGINAN